MVIERHHKQSAYADDLFNAAHCPADVADHHRLYHGLSLKHVGLKLEPSKTEILEFIPMWLRNDPLVLKTDN
jgi:hypothetical protein